MVRKIIHIGLSITLLISTAGISISKHYCCDRLISVSLYSNADPCCDEQTGRCDDETENYRLDDDFTAVENLQIKQIEGYEILNLFVLFSFLLEPVSDSYDDYLIPELPSPPTQRQALSLLQTYLC